MPKKSDKEKENITVDKPKKVIIKSKASSSSKATKNTEDTQATAVKKKVKKVVKKKITLIIESIKKINKNHLSAKTIKILENIQIKNPLKLQLRQKIIHIKKAAEEEILKKEIMIKRIL